MTVAAAVRLASLGVALVFSGFGANAQDLEAGKTPQQLFSSNCSACHRSPQGLAKGNSAATVSRFLTQHYTTGRQPAAALGAYLASVGGQAPPATARGRQPAETPQQAARPPEPGAKPTAAEERAKRREAREQREEKAAERRERQAAAEQRAYERAKRALRDGEPPTVQDDPDPVLFADEPVALLHSRASSRADIERDWAAFAASLAPKPAHAVAATTAIAPAGAAAGTSGATAPTDPARPDTAPAAGDAIITGLAASSAAGGQLFSAPLP